MGRTIFISYRRSDSATVTGRLTDHLAARYGRDSYFKDVDSIPLGDDFRQAIEKAVGACRVFLAVIGEHWISATTPEGARRIDDAEDYVQVEIGAALEKGLPVIPVLVEGALMPAPAQLPRAIQDLAYRNATRVRPDPDFKTDMKRLFRQIDQVLGPDAPPSRARRRFGVGGLVVVLLAVALAAWLSRPDDPAGPPPTPAPFHVETAPAEAGRVTFVNETDESLVVRLYNADDALYVIPRKTLTVAPGAEARWDDPPGPFRLRVARPGLLGRVLATEPDLTPGTRVVLKGELPR